MFERVQWLLFDVGSTLMDERAAYEHRLQDIADSAKVSYERVYKMAVEFYKQNKKGDLETARFLGAALPGWHTEDEILYDDAAKCLQILSQRYKIGIIANQLPGTKERLERHGVLKYINLVIASAEEGVAKPDKRIFEIALEKSNCKPCDAVMIGDRIDNDIIPAKALGIHTIWVKQGFGKYWTITDNMERAEYVVNNLAELCDVL